VIKKLQSYNELLICAYNHLMWCEEITVRLGSLKMVSEGSESIRVENRMQFGIHNVVHKIWLIYS